MCIRDRDISFSSNNHQNELIDLTVELSVIVQKDKTKINDPSMIVNVNPALSIVIEFPITGRDSIVYIQPPIVRVIEALFFNL